MNQENDTTLQSYADAAQYLPWLVFFALLAYAFDKLKFWKKKECITTANYEPAVVVQYKKKRGYL